MHNTTQEFVGLQTLKVKQANQLALFEQWASQKKWYLFHHSHYDWWMFPIDEPSSYRFTYVFYDEDIADLKTDAKYIAHYLHGVELLALSWGWDLKSCKQITHSDEQQSWQNWPIRLYKCSKSLQLFGFNTEFQSMRQYAQYLLTNGHNFHYNNRDLSVFFKKD